MQLKNKVAFVTGASSGIGKAAAILYQIGSQKSDIGSQKPLNNKELFEMMYVFINLKWYYLDEKERTFWRALELV